MNKLNKDFLEGEFEDLSFEEQHEYIIYHYKKIKNSNTKRLILNAILKITTLSFVDINGDIGESGSVYVSQSKSKELFDLFIELRKELYGTKLLVNSYGELEESCLNSYKEAALARIEDGNISNFKDFYNKIQDGYEYSDWGFTNEILFVEDWFKTYKNLKLESLI